MLALALAFACSPSPVPGDPIAQLEPADPSVAGQLPPPPSASDEAVVTINEIQAKNRSTLQNETWEFPDWVELYNSGGAPVDLRDLSLTDASGKTWRGPDQGELKPGETLLLIADGDEDEELHLPFDLGSDGSETLSLAVRGSRVDVVPVGELDDDQSLARFPDGGVWHPTGRATPGWTNGSAPAPIDPADYLFATYVMHEVELSIQPSLFGALDSGTAEPAQASVDGIYFPKILVRNTGQGSFDPMSGKPRLVLNLDAFDTDREFRGVDNLELHNGKTADQTRARDYITYKYAGLAGLPASRVGWCHLTLNGEDYGLYVIVEDPDDKWLEKRFPESADDGMIFEGADYGDFADPSGFDYEVGPDVLDPESLAAMEAADAIVEGAATNAAVAQLWNYIEHDEMLNYLAWEGISDHWDGYQSPHNWRIYVDGVTHRTQWVPAGVEITWENDQEIWASNGQVYQWCESNHDCKHDYAEHVLTMADLADDSDLVTDFENVFAWLKPYIAADPKKFQDMNTVNAVYNNSVDHLISNPEAARKAVYAEFPDLHP